MGLLPSAKQDIKLSKNEQHKELPDHIEREVRDSLAAIEAIENEIQDYVR